jgi:DASH complex subunit DAM1
MADLEANFMHLQLMHESLTRFSESFASFLYGLNMNAFCVDFPEVFHLAVIPTRRVLIPRIGSYSRVFPQSKASRGTERLAESWSHARQITSGNANVSPEAEAEQLQSTNNDGDMTFLYVPSAQSLVQFCSFPLT